MGCWNGTCGISNLPIRAGDDVVALLIGFFSYNDEPAASGYCYPTDIASPLTLPFYGQYDDYGGIENLKSSYVLDTMSEQFGDIAQNVQSFINDEVERDQFSTGWILFDNEPPRTVKVGLWMVHKEIFDSFKNKPGGWWTNGIPVADLIRKDFKLFRTWVKKREKDVRFLIDNGEGKRRPIEEILAALESGLKLEPLEVMSRMRWWELTNPRNSDIGCSSSYDNYYMMYSAFCGSGYAGGSLITNSFFEHYRVRILRAIVDDDEDFLAQHIEDVVGYGCMKGAMSAIRTGFNSHCGKGSQSDEYQSYIDLMKAMTNLIKREEKEMLDSGWDEDFEGFDWE